MIPQIKVYGVPHAVRAFEQLPRRVQFRHLRIALNAGGGVIRDAYKARAHQETGLLAKSIGVKVAIPDASFNPKHHGKPAYAVIGVKRKAGRIVRLNKQGKLKGFGAGQKELNAARVRLTKEGKLTPRQRDRFAVKLALKNAPGAVFRNPSRYAHLAGPDRKGVEVFAAAVSASKAQAGARIIDKLKQGLTTEAAALAGA